MENRVAIELRGEGSALDAVADDELRSFALLDGSAGQTLKRQGWAAAAGAGAVRTAVVEYHLEGVAHAAIAQLDGADWRGLQVRACRATPSQSAGLLATGTTDTQLEFAGRLVSREAAELRQRIELRGGQLAIELQTTAEGGTGGKLWDATPILAEWALAHADMWRGCAVHELGAGLGLPGLAIALGASPERVVVSDCVQECLTAMESSVELNGLEGKIAVRRFDWREVAVGGAEPSPELRADIVLCSDVVYSREVADWLPPAAQACLRPGGRLFALLPLSRIGCRECLSSLGALLEPFEPEGAESEEMAAWIRQHLGDNQLGHRLYGFRAPAAARGGGVGAGGEANGQDG